MQLPKMIFTRFWCDFELKQWETMNMGEEMEIKSIRIIMSKVREMRTGGMMVVGEKMDQVGFEEEVVGGALEEEECGGLGEDLDLQVVGLAEGLDQGLSQEEEDLDREDLLQVAGTPAGDLLCHHQG